MSKAPAFLVWAAVCGLAVSEAAADSVEPSSFAATIGVGESVTTTSTVVVSEGRGSNPVDAFFLSDATGSMGGVIGTVRNAFSGIVTETSALGDVQYGVGEYRDLIDPVPFAIGQNLTANTGAVQGAIGSLVARGGGDIPEDNFGALRRVAGEVNWRPDSERILVWFGDAPGHDPSLIDGTTEAGAIAALQGKNVSVQAFNASTNPLGGINEAGQAQRVVDATGGTLQAFSTSSLPIEEVVKLIGGAITGAVFEYDDVALRLVDVPDGLEVTADTLSVTGDFDRSTERRFPFALTFAGAVPGEYEVTLEGFVDGVRVGSERLTLTVTPLPAPLFFAAVAFGGLGFAARHRRRTTGGGIPS